VIGDNYFCRPTTFPTLEAYAAFLHAVIDRRCN